SRALGANGHITIEAYANERIEGYQAILPRMRAVPGVTSLLPVLDGQVLLTTNAGGARGGLVRGVAQEDLRSLRIISDHIIAGSLEKFTGNDAIVIGAGIAASYRLGIGD